MSENTSEQEVQRWKRQYYDHLDLLNEKEKHWQALESILIEAVLRLSLAAEGQHLSIDRHLQDIRSEAKGQINIIRFGSILDEISALMLKLGSKPLSNKKIIPVLESLLEAIEFPDAFDRQKKKLLKKLARSTDESSRDLVDELQQLLSESLRQPEDPGDTEQKKTKSASYENLFGSKLESSDENDTGDVKGYLTISNSIARIAEALPWPLSLEQEATSVLQKLRSSMHGELDENLAQFVTLIQKWQPDLTADAVSRSEAVDGLSSTNVFSSGALDPADADMGSSDVEDEPSVKEILVRLLEQLMVSPDLLDEVDRLKHRIVDESSAVSWKQLLRDVAHLINVLRSRINEEKQEFESFLQQISGRLKEMDGFLAIETASLDEAEQASDAFDVLVNAQVQDIHDDMSAADDPADLKSKVEKRLNVVSRHIKQYRYKEHERYKDAQQNLEALQSRMVLLEQESGDLRKLIVEKNREAMFDALTGVPNRLSYEKKVAEEIARCKRFESHLCMVVWDIDKFKSVNDTYGHKMGDKVLKVIAQLLNNRIRETDFLARYGGEEFVMFLPGINEAEALKVADSLREKIAANTFKNDEEIIKITLSCGISSYVEGDSHESIFERADKALYKAKHDGRNQCVIFS